jgi:reactive intermediate/imine deaminase
MTKTKIHASAAPQAIGPYSQAIQMGNTIYLSGQLGLNPKTMTITDGTIVDEIEQIFKNMRAVCEEAGANLNHIVKLTIYLTDLSYFSHVNEIMLKHFNEPFPARTTIQVSALPKDAQVEIDAVLIL